MIERSFLYYLGQFKYQNLQKNVYSVDKIYVKFSQVLAIFTDLYYNHSVHLYVPCYINKIYKENKK